MEINDAFYDHFLEELNALEKFRLSYSGIHKADILGRDDPDVRRLIEAMAFFTARTKASALHNINKTNRRLFDQYFAFLLTPLPAAAILQCEISGRLTDAVSLPKDSEIAVYSSPEQPAIFRTLCDLSVLPISLRQAQLVPTQPGFRILLHFQTPYPRNDAIGVLSLYLNYLNSYNSSLRFMYTLKKHLQRVWVSGDDQITENSQGDPCPFAFGLPETPDSAQNGDISHPLGKVRLFFHFPQQRLYLNLQVPELPRNWTHFTIAMELDRHWPKSFNITREIFQLFTVPIVNLKQNMAKPILCNGTQDSYPLYFPDPKRHFVLHSVLGVFQITKDGLEPIKPGIIKGDSGSYEVENSHDQSATRLMIHLPQAFANPVKIAVEALWLQPWFSEKISQQLTVFPYSKNIEGVLWGLLGEVRPHQENLVSQSGEGIVEFMSLQKKPIFSLDEIQFLLKIIGSVAKSPFQHIPPLLQKLEVVTVPQTRKTGIKHVYHFLLKEGDETSRPFVEEFLQQLLSLLQTCSANASVAIRAQTAGAEEIIELE